MFVEVLVRFRPEDKDFVTRPLSLGFLQSLFIRLQ
jgi:hypothetical protein